MKKQNWKVFFYLLLCLLPFLYGAGKSDFLLFAPKNIEFVNGKWFNGKSFDGKTVYCVNGLFTFHKPARIDTTLDLLGTWIVPPFAEAHNHNLNGIEDRDRKVIQRYLADGVFYVQIQGNLPLNEEARKRLAPYQPDKVDPIFANGLITATGGHPIRLFENILLPTGVYPGYNRETIKDYLYFTIDSASELDRKWPLILKRHPDFIKTMLVFSEEFEKRKDDTAYFGRKGLDPHLLSMIVIKAHASNLRVSTHVTTAADFHNALEAGVDEIAHIPPAGDKPISTDDAKLAAKCRIPVVTIGLFAIPSLIRMGVVPEADVRRMIIANLKILYQNGVTLAIGSDNPTGTSVKEVEFLHRLGIFDNLTLLKMWCEATPKVIFSNRKIGKLKEGYEASFLALEGNPLDDFNNIKKIKIRFKQKIILNNIK